MVPKPPSESGRKYGKRVSMGKAMGKARRYPNPMKRLDGRAIDGNARSGLSGKAVRRRK
jgi:hypothetical protein